MLHAADRAEQAMARLSERELNRYYLAAAALDMTPTAEVIFAFQMMSSVHQLSAR